MKFWTKSLLIGLLVICYFLNLLIFLNLVEIAQNIKGLYDFIVPFLSLAALLLLSYFQTKYCANYVYFLEKRSFLKEIKERDLSEKTDQA